jgi:hypothetical protein
VPFGIRKPVDLRDAGAALSNGVLIIETGPVGVF